ncbi:MAG: hypothetical protein ABIJ59_08960 [Pseudomonadota bacterium]
MIRYFKITALCLVSLCLFTHPVMAKGQVETQVMVIHASTGSNHIDPGLLSVVANYQSRFNYTSYRLISSKNMTLGFNQNGQVSVPAGRTLIVTPLQMSGQRISFQINMLKNNRSVFQTHVLLNNHSSVTIGGPQFDNGDILINIQGSVP